MKRSQVLTKLDTYRSLHEQELLTDEVLQTSIQKSLEDGSLKKLPVSAFAKEAAALLAFAQEYGLVKEVSAAGEEGEGGGTRGAEKAIAATHPDVAAALEAIEVLKKRVFRIVIKDQEIAVQYQPYWRTVKPKAATTEGEVEV